MSSANFCVAASASTRTLRSSAPSRSSTEECSDSGGSARGVMTARCVIGSLVASIAVLPLATLTSGRREGTAQDRRGLISAAVIGAGRAGRRGCRRPRSSRSKRSSSGTTPSPASLRKRTMLRTNGTVPLTPNTTTSTVNNRNPAPCTGPWCACKQLLSYIRSSMHACIDAYH